MSRYRKNILNSTEGADKMNYVTDGLIAHFDGKNNVGSGHDTTTTSWTDLTGNGYDMIFYGSNFSTNFSWDTNKLIVTSNGALNQYLYSANKTFSPTRNFTLECCYQIASHTDLTHSAIAVQLYGGSSSSQGEFILMRSQSSGYYRYMNSTQHYENMQNSSSHPSINIGETATISFIKPYNYFYNDGTHNLVTYKNGGNKFNSYACNYYSQYRYGYPSGLRIYVPRTTYTAGMTYTAYVHSIRLYDRQLTDTEVLQNYTEDKKRFKF